MRRENVKMSKHKKRSKGARIALTCLKVFLGILSFVLVTVLAVAATLFFAMKLICSDISPAARSTFVTTILETGQMKFLASWYLSPDEIQAIVDNNSMGEMIENVDPGLIQIGIGSEGSNKNPNNTSTEPEKDITIIPITGKGSFDATLMIVKDPSRVSLTTIYPWREYGVTLDKLVKDAGAVAGVNAGMYQSSGNKGGRPIGVVVSNGEIQLNEPEKYKGLVLIGLTEDNILQIIDIDGKTKKEVEQIIKSEKIRDATTFQEDTSDSNNHFVKLVINGQARELNGQGSGQNPRTVIGQRRDGALMLLVTDGRGSKGHIGATAADLISIMLEYGAVNAANLDGGSSSCMYYEGEFLMPSVTLYYSDTSWRLPFAFVVK